MIEISQYLTFMINGEFYGISVSHVREVLVVPQIAKIPRMPQFMKGVINLRGAVVPVIDLKSKFNQGDTELTVTTAIIVLEIPDIDKEGVIVVGVFADMVHKVLTIDRPEIEAVANIGLSINTDFLVGIGKVDGKFIMILDVTAVLTKEDLGPTDMIQ